jgi:hypothetical protein
MRERLTDHPTRLAATTSRREIPDDYRYNPKKAKHLKHILHNVSVALGTLTSSLNEFSRVKGPEISPDGRLGGVGYIMALTDIKQTINSTVHNLSNIADCLADELTNPKWNVADEKETKELIKEKDDAVEKIDEVSDDINPDDITNEVTDEPEPEKKPEKETKPEEPEKDSEAGFELKLASAVKNSLVNYFECRSK